MLTISRWKIIAVVAATIFGILFTLPNVLPQGSLPGWMPQPRLNLGLDLQGGSYLLLEVDTRALKQEKLTNTVEDIRQSLRNEKIPFSDLAVSGDGVNVRITDPARVNDAVNLLQSSQGQPLPGAPGGREFSVSRDGQRIRLAFVDEAFNAEAGKAVEQSIEIIRRRIDELGTREPTIIRQGINRIVVQAPGESDPERLKNVIGQTAKLTFQMVDDSVDPALISEGRTPPGTELLPSTDGYRPFYVVNKRALVTGEMLTDARQANDPQSGQPVVSFRFDSTGARRFGEATRAENVGKAFAIILDGKIISAPRINEPITGGSGQITGNFTFESANDLAVLLRAGALPAPLNVEEQRTVGAELGADAVKAGQISTGVGFVAILVFMLLSYGLLFGGISVIALLVNGLLIIATMSVTQATLTLPGVAGLILTLAVAVDANVLIYERMRDELRAGRTVIASMEAGFSKAMSTIIDANVTTILAALIMFQFGSGPVKGFAWTLSIGVITSMFTAVYITQVLLAWWLRSARPKTLPIV